MQNTVNAHLDSDGTLHDLYKNEAKKSAVSWAAITGGAVVAGAITLSLMLLGSGIGLASVSPWPNSGMTASKASIMAVVWMVLTQWISSGLGGYLTGRLRTKWAGVHTHEVFFRDTAHGFMTWSVATIVCLTLMGSVAGSMIGGASKMAMGALGGAAAGAGAQSMQSSGSGQAGEFSVDDYMVDTLFRTEPNAAAPAAANAGAANPFVIRNEAARILVTDLKGDSVPDQDRAYLAQLVASRTGLSQTDAQARVDNVLAQLQDAKQKAKQAADDARKAASKLAVMTFLSMLIGAFIACVAAALGGMERDGAVDVARMD